MELAFLGMEGLVSPRGLPKAIDDLVEGRPQVIVLGNVHQDQVYRNRIRELLKRRDYRVVSRNTSELIFTYPGTDVISTETHHFPSSSDTYSITVLRHDERSYILITFDIPLGANARHRRTLEIKHLVSHPTSKDSSASLMVGNFGFDEWMDLVDIDPGREGAWRDVWSLKGGSDEAISSELGRPHRIYARLANVDAMTSVETLRTEEVFRKVIRVRVAPL